MNNPSTSNVVQLNRKISKSSLLNAEQAIETAKQIRVDLSDDVTEVIMDVIMGILMSHGILSDSGKVDGRDMIMIEQSVQEHVS